MIPQRLLSVDPAGIAGWALWRDGVLSGWGDLAIANQDEAPSRIVRRWWNTHPNIGANAAVERHDVLVVESHGASMRNRITAERLIEHRRTWEVLGELNGWSVERVLTQTWQAAILGRARRGHEKEIAAMVAAGVVEAARFAVPCLLGEDAADAICLGKFWLTKQRLDAAGAKR